MNVHQDTLRANISHSLFAGPPDQTNIPMVELNISGLINVRLIYLWDITLETACASCVSQITNNR